jgi:hypothetical protein
LYISIGASIGATIIYALVNSRQTKVLPSTTITPAPKSAAADVFRRVPSFSFHASGSNEMVRGLFGSVVRMLAKNALQRHQNKVAPGKP